MTKDNGLTVPERFEVAMPDAAPALGFDPAKPFSWHDVLTSNYMTLDWLEDKIEAIGGGNPVLTPNA